MKILLAVAALFFSSMSFANKTCVVIGDSIMSYVPQGVMSQHSLHLLAAEKNLSIRNLSSPGSSLGNSDKTGFNSGRVNSAIDLIFGAWGKYDCVIVQAGTNDFARSVPLSDTVDSLRRILERVRVDGKQALVLDPIYRDGEDVPNSLGDTLNTQRYFMWHVCTQEYGSVCNFAHRGNTVMGAMNNNYDATEVSQGRRLHPNAVGHRKLADWIKAEAAAAGLF